MEKLMWYVKEMQEEWINVCRPQFQQYDLLYMCIISKHYWLIKWLVEKNRVDFSNIKRIILNYKVEDNEAIEYYDLDFATKEETLLMLLAIKENPIDFLLSVLK